MVARLAADALVVLHLAFIVFVVAGGLLAFRRVAWSIVHIPALAWGAWIEFSGAICPLTPLENAFRAQGGSAGYPGGFIDHYIVPLIYPEALEPRAQLLMGIGVLAMNGIVYAVLLMRIRRRRRDFRATIGRSHHRDTG